MAEKCLAPEEPKAEKTLLQNKALSYGLAKNSRLHLKRDFEDVFKNGKKCATGGLVLWWRPDSCAGGKPASARMGIVVSKKLGIAAHRNRVKRLLREVFRLNRHELQHGVAFVISPRESGNFEDFNTARDAVFKLWQKAGILRTQSPLGREKKEFV